ncbi:DNA repair protein RadC [Paenibacillus sophorae]|uniref:DNA repair protein RadC n=1 Tax=Paenibacillus sophorae TaxID=1333845 RepID=A0A1H8TJG5_9BACL|nr:DNA repair protein RadC [Paenibacillus sophorae]QWU16242.1 DNA repair protein RadC [Paenibacillus sophorae]SEO90951.1 DNA repair protein RadC [Paenibacillus sophorae]
MSKENAAKRIEFVTLRMVREKTSLLYPQRVIRKPEDAAELFRQLIGDCDREVFCVMTLDTKNQPTAFQTVSIGTLNASLVHPREVYKICMISNAASLMCFHNHPSGNPVPSSEDIEITERLRDSGTLLGIELLDHIILGDGNFVSMKERGLM